MEQFPSWIAANPIASFTLLLLASLTVPPLFERLRLPGLVGLLIAGVILGPYGLRLLDPQTETVKLLSDIGKIYLMFVAGLEIDMQAFRKTRDRSLSFGFATFIVPLIFGTLTGRLFGFGWNASILIGSLLASHTLLAYPLIQRLGVVRNEAVTVTVGATIFTDISALMVLAICVSIHQGEFSWYSLPLQLGLLAAYATTVLWGLDRLGRAYFRRTGNDEGNQFLFILLALFLASVGAQLIRTENIVGAFLAGLAVNDVLGRGAVKEKIEFVGGVLFIPFFFVAMGLLIDIPVFTQTLLSELLLVAAVVASLIGSKFLAALSVKRLYRYTWSETLTMWSLSLPQVAATLAAALVGLEVGLLSEALFNSIIVLMLVTSILGPVLTQRFASQLPFSEADAAAAASPPAEDPTSDRSILVSVYNPITEPYLIEMAALLAQEREKIVPLAIAQASTHLNEVQLSETIWRSRKLLKQAAEISHSLGLETRPLLRIDSDVALGICHAAREEDARLILMGYGDMTTLQARLLGNVIDQVFRISHCPVAVMQLRDSPRALKRILVAIKDLLAPSLQLVCLAQQLAHANQGTVTVLHICPPTTSQAKRHEFKRQLVDTQSLLPTSRLKVVSHTDTTATILRVSQPFDIVMLTDSRTHVLAGLTPDDLTLSLMQKLTCSTVLFSANTA
ncbi:MAG: universal stress protein [Leptolyngbya sp. SIO4C5]|nr:universal stress protein [Leptolyngbya sp. SIO4C5]